MMKTVSVHQLYRRGGGGHITTHSKWPGGPFDIIVENYPGEPSAGGNRVQGGGRTSTMAHL